MSGFRIVAFLWLLSASLLPAQSLTYTHNLPTGTALLCKSSVSVIRFKLDSKPNLTNINLTLKAGSLQTTSNTTTIELDISSLAEGSLYTIEYSGSADSAAVPLTSTPFSTNYLLDAGPIMNIGSPFSGCRGSSFSHIATVTGTSNFTNIYGGTFEHEWNTASVANTPVSATGVSISGVLNTTSTYVLTTFAVLGGNREPTCYNTASITISTNPNPVVTVPSAFIKCFNEVLTLSSTITQPTTGPYQYFWSSDNGLLENSFSANPTYAAGVGTGGNFTLVDKNGCTSVGNILIQVNPQMSLTVPITDTTLCEQSSATLSAQAAGGTPGAGYRYAWKHIASVAGIGKVTLPWKGLINDSTLASPSVKPYQFDYSDYEVTAFDSRNCKVRDTVKVRKHFLGVELGYQATDTLLCAGQELLFVSSITGGREPVNYTWSNNGSAVSGNTSSKTIKLPGGSSNNVRVVLLDGNGCTVSDSARVRAREDIKTPTSVALDIPDIFGLPDNTYALDNIQLCRDSPLQIDMSVQDTARYTYRWSEGVHISNTTVPNPVFLNSRSEDLSYTLTVTSVNTGCTKVNNFKFISASQGRQPDIAISPNETKDGKLQVFMSDARKTFEYVFTNTQVSPLNLYAWHIPGSVVSFQSESADDVLTARFGTVGGVNVYLYALNKVNYCLSKDSLSFDVIRNASSILYIPNTFSPYASKAENQRFRIFADAVEIEESGFSMKVYNVLGDLVYETTNKTEALEQGWDGVGYTAGVYTYVVKGQFINGDEFTKSGAITLRR